MSSESYWYQDHKEAKRYLTDLFAAAPVNASFADMDDGRPRAVIKLDAPIGEPLYLTAHIQGPTLRFIAHQVVVGKPTAQSQENCRQVNLAPWGGRIYPSADQTGTDISFGIPIPPSQPKTLQVEAYIRLIFESAMQLRSLKTPDYFGPATPDPKHVERAISEFVAAEYPNFSKAHGGNVFVIDTMTAAGHAVRLEMFILDARLVVARAHLAYDIVENDEGSVTEKLTWINEAAAAGAIAWDSSTRHLTSHVVLYPAFMQITDYELNWIEDEAMKIVDAAVAGNQ